MNLYHHFVETLKFAGGLRWHLWDPRSHPEVQVRWPCLGPGLSMLWVLRLWALRASPGQVGGVHTGLGLGKDSLAVAQGSEVASGLGTGRDPGVVGVGAKWWHRISEDLEHEQGLASRKDPQGGCLLCEPHLTPR